MKSKGKVIHKVFKVKYEINLLQPLGEYVSSIEDVNKPGSYVKTWINKDRPLSYLLSSATELDIFKTDPIMEIIHYKWDVFGRQFHYHGFVMNLLYVILVNVYINRVYIHDQDRDYQEYYIILLLVGTIYPV